VLGLCFHGSSLTEPGVFLGSQGKGGGEGTAGAHNSICFYGLEHAKVLGLADKLQHIIEKFARSTGEIKEL
jgi:hypothetical protein